MLGKLTPLVGNFLALRVKPEQAQNRPSLIARVLTQLEEKACEWAKPPVSTQASAAAKQREAQLLLREQRIASMSPGQAIIEIIESGSMRDMENLIARSPEILSDSKSITLKCLRPSPGFRKRGDLVQVILDEIAAR